MTTEDAVSEGREVKLGKANEEDTGQQATGQSKQVHKKRMIEVWFKMSSKRLRGSLPYNEKTKQYKYDTIEYKLYKKLQERFDK